MRKQQRYPDGDAELGKYPSSFKNYSGRVGLYHTIWAFVLFAAVQDDTAIFIRRTGGHEIERKRNRDFGPGSFIQL